MAVKSRASRCFENMLGDSGLYVGSLISTFDTALATQDARTIEKAREEVVKALDRIEGEQFL